MESPNFWALHNRLTADCALDPTASMLVESSLLGDDALTAALDGTAPTIDTHARPVGGERTRPPGVLLRRLEVEAFRGIGPLCKLELPEGPGLTLVVGRNGSGKSSLSEGLEHLLTGDSLRWKDRTPAAVWASGWRNLHVSTPTRLAATFHLEGHGEVVVERIWPLDASLDESALTIDANIDESGWDSALESSRPFLSYNELGSALERKPSALYDLFAGLLGMDDVVAARRRLGDRHKALEDARKTSRKQRDRLVANLRSSSDPRAEQALAAFGARKTDLEALDVLVLATEEETAPESVQLLRKLASLAGPDTCAVRDAVSSLRIAVDLQLKIAGTEVGRALSTAMLIEQALNWFEGTDETTCPVCGTSGVLGTEWQSASAERARGLRESARLAKKAADAVRKSVSTARSLVASVAAPPSHAHECVVAARQAHEAWAKVPEDPLELASHLEAKHEALHDAYQAVADAAREELVRLRVEWLPLKMELVGWLEVEREVLARTPVRKALKLAENWLKAAGEELRGEAFEPIADRAMEIFAQLSLHSNVDLVRPILVGTSTYKQRRVALGGTVDGAEGHALAVMSQGELHALALSLFLPRLMRPESPFRFLVIDDPVQAMDPSKVEGLARVLEEAARTHQVVVLTHDTRLPEAVVRLGITARVVQVTRRDGSRVRLQNARGPAFQNLDDAHYLVQEKGRLDPELVRAVVPGLCRAAVEAALTERAWSERLAEGRRHEEIQDQIERSHGLRGLAAYALLGDRNAGKEVPEHLEGVRAGSAKVFGDLLTHAHTLLPPEVDAKAFIVSTKTLVEAVRP